MKANKSGFTLIELLIVVLVILMLSALLFRVAGLIGDRASRAKAISEIQMIQNALNEYFAEYGTYPPIQYDAKDPNASMRYVFEHAAMQPPVLRRAKTSEYGATGEDIGYQYGLVAHLFKRARGNTFKDGGDDKQSQSLAYNKDTARDEAAKERWASYLNNINLASDFTPGPEIMSGQPYSNMVLTINDPWGRSYRYDSPPPHLSYRLWSVGPDGQDGTADDISNETF